jgi:CRP/FNR family transcriptional regulator, cyclic AMP receptor protein
MCAARELQVKQLISRHRKSWRAGSFLAGLEPGALEALVAGGSATCLEPGKKLIVEGDAAGDVFLLFDAVMTVTMRPGTLLAFRVGGDIVGEMAIMEGGTRSATVTVRSGRLAVPVPGDTFMAIIEDYPDARKLLDSMLSGRLRDSDKHRADFRACSVLQRVARELARLADEYGQSGPDGSPSTLMRMGITQKDLAMLVGAGVATVEDAVTELKSRRILKWAYKTFEVLDVEALRRVAYQGNSS